MATHVKSARGEATPDICIYFLQSGYKLLGETRTEGPTVQRNVIRTSALNLFYKISLSIQQCMFYEDHLLTKVAR